MQRSEDNHISYQALPCLRWHGLLAALPARLCPLSFHEYWDYRPCCSLPYNLQSCQPSFVASGCGPWELGTTHSYPNTDKQSSSGLRTSWENSSPTLTCEASSNLSGLQKQHACCRSQFQSSHYLCLPVHKRMVTTSSGSPWSFLNTSFHLTYSVLNQGQDLKS